MTDINQTFKAWLTQEHYAEDIMDIQAQIADKAVPKWASSDYEYNNQDMQFTELVKVLTSNMGDFVIEKNIAYGNSVETSKEIMRILYPNGISTEQMGDSLMIVRIIDKLMRIATKKDAFGESPWNDIFGYALLALVANYKK